jgi:ECF sigma factor
MTRSVDRGLGVPEKARLVTLRYFGGLSLPEAADALGVSLRTADRWWHFTRTWLYTSLESIFFAALERPRGECGAYLDTELRACLDKILAAQPDLGYFLDRLHPSPK